MKQRLCQTVTVSHPNPRPSQKSVKIVVRIAETGGKTARIVKNSEREVSAGPPTLPTEEQAAALMSSFRESSRSKRKSNRNKFPPGC